jgi:hypothetical protein
MAKMVDTLNIVDTLSATLFGTSISIVFEDDGQMVMKQPAIESVRILICLRMFRKQNIYINAFDEKGRIIQI